MRKHDKIRWAPVRERGGIMSYDTLDKLYAVSTGIEGLDEIKAALMTPIEQVIVERAFDIARESEPAFLEIIDKWLSIREPGGVTIVGTLVVYQTISRAPGLLLSVNMRRKLVSSLIELLESPYAKVRMTVIVVFTFMASMTDMLHNKQVVSRAILDRLRREAAGGPVAGEMRRFLEAFPP